MYDSLKNVMPDINDALNGVKGRKYVTDATARDIALRWSDRGTSALYALAQTGEIKDLSALRAEIWAYADTVASITWDDRGEENIYASLIALDVYVCKIKGKSRKPVKGWNPALALVA